MCVCGGGGGGMHVYVCLSAYGLHCFESTILTSQYLLLLVLVV